MKSGFESIQFGTHIRKQKESMPNFPEKWSKWREEFLAMHSDSRRKEWLSVRTLVCELTNTSTPFSKTKLQKPFLPQHPDIGLSISHSDSYLAVLISPVRGVGIDIQELSIGAQNIQKKFMTQEEVDLCLKANLDQLTLSNLVWSNKEALFKANQRNPVRYKEEFHLSSISKKSDTSFDLKYYLTKTDSQMTVRCTLHPEYILSEVSPKTVI